jgi:hypothetical protein
MYLARFAGTEGHFSQALVRVHFARASDRATNEKWSSLYAALTSLPLGMREAQVGFRLRLLPNGGLDATYLLLAPAEAEGELRRLVGAFSRLETLIPGSVELPICRETFDAIVSQFPRLRGAVSLPRARAGSCWIAQSFRAAQTLDELFTNAAMLQHGIAYQANLTPFAPSREARREVKRNVARLDQVPGAPDEMVRLQAQLAERFGIADRLCDEVLAADSPDAAEWLERELKRIFGNHGREASIEPPSVQLLEGCCEDEIALMAAAREIEIDELCARAADPSESERLLGWQPQRPELFRLPLAGQDGEWTGPLAALAGSPTADEPSGDFAFVSYRRADQARVLPLIRQLRELQVPVWWDREIPGGSEWNSVLEERIQNANLLVLFLSDRAVDSRYVRREVQYADALGKPLLTVRLDDAELRHGLALLLQQHQILDAREPDFSAALRKALVNLIRVPVAG